MSDTGVRGPLPRPPLPHGEGPRGEGGGRGREPAGAGGRGGEPGCLGAARDYTRRGWRVVPLPRRAKAPALAGWQSLRLDEGDLPGWFAQEGANIGLLLGAPSGGLVDVDCDAPEAVRAAALLLPPTGRVSGRASHPRSHYWYVVTEGEPPRTAKFAWEDARGTQGAGAGEGARRGTQGAGAGDVRGLNVPAEARAAAEFTPRAPAPAALQPGAAMPRPAPAALQPGPGAPTAHPGAMLVELRSTGCQTVAPPSVHPSGERVRWEAGGDGEPGRISGAELRRAAARVAACALLARHWPRQGTRDEAALALSGMLVRGGWPADEADDFARAVARVAGDEEWPKRGKAAQSARALAAGEPVMGAPALAQRLSGADGDGERVVARAREWLGLGEPSDASKVLKGAKDAHYRDVSIFGVDEQLCSVVLSDVAPRPLRWLWEGRIPLGKIALLDGDPGLGKSMLTLDLIARVTTGRCRLTI